MKMDAAIGNKTKENKNSHMFMLVSGMVKEQYTAI